MKGLYKRLGIVFICLLLSCKALFSQEEQRQPNIIVILIDDMGWNDTGFSGNPLIETPCLDDLAEEGVVFTQAYAPAPNCAPSRACLLTGLYTPRHGVYTVADEEHSPGKPNHKILSVESESELAPEAVTLGEIMSEGGYRTGMFGMWNLGKGKNRPSSPTGQGFDVFIEPRDLGFDKDGYKKELGEYLTDALTDSSIEFVRENRDLPFFLYTAFHGIHAPFDPPEELLLKYRDTVSGRRLPDDFAEYAATVEAVDLNMGRLWEEVRNLGLADNTYLFFTSDNGGIRQHTAPLKDGKGSLYEGGIRVPLFITGPGIEGGRSSETPVTAIDFLPTIIQLTDLEPRWSNGLSLVPLLVDNQSLEERPLFWHFPCYIGGGGPVSSVRLGSYKLIEFFESDTIELYNLETDPYEKRNLLSQEPGKADEMYELLRGWQESTGAPCPREPNPDYDPAYRAKRTRREL